MKINIEYEQRIRLKKSLNKKTEKLTNTMTKQQHSLLYYA